MLRYLLLGPMAVERDGALLDLGPPKQRAVLALLAQQAGGTVSTDRLLETVWGADRSPGAQSSLHANVSRLRRLLRTDASAPPPVVRRAHGYALDIGRDDVDVTQFLDDADLVQRAADRHDWPEVVTAAQRALGRWRGAYLEDFADEEWVRVAAVSLAERRSGLQQTLVTALLGVGDVPAALSGSTELLDAHPLMERATWLHMVTLYRAGRAAEALAAYQAFAARIDAELGLDTGIALRDLQAAILRNDRDFATWPAGEPGSPRTRPSAAVSAVETPKADPAGLIVGRDTEVAVLRAALGAARAGRSQWAVLTGAPGIGKTRLAQEAVDIWQRAGHRVARGQCPDLEPAPAWWPIRQLLRDLDVPPESIFAAAASGDVDAARVAVYERIADVLRAHLAGGPLLLFVDDLHWADRASLGLLTVLAETFDAPGLAVLLTARSRSPRPDLDRLFEAAARRPTSRQLDLAPLSRTDVARLAEQVSGEALDATETAGLAERTGGTPFFVVEYARLPAQERRTAGIPAAVRSVLRRRLAVLTDDQLDVLRVAAVVADPIDVTLLAGITHRDPDDVADQLDEAADHDLLVPSATANAYAFNHALMREELAAAVPTLRRQRLHLQAAEFLDPASGPDAVIGRAAHLRAAGPAAEATAALGAFRDAAEAAERQLQYDVAATWWAAALEAFDRTMPNDEKPRDDFVRARVRNLAWAGRGQAVLDVLDAALVEALRAGRTASVGRLAANLLRVSGAWPWPVYGSDPAPLMVTLRGLDTMLTDDPAARARVLAVTAIGHCYDPDPGVPEELSARALELAEQTGDPAVLADAILGRALTYAGVATHSAESIGLLDQLAGLRYENAKADDVLRHNLLTMATMNLGQTHACAEHVQAGAVAAELFRTPINRVQLRWAEASLAQWRGDLIQAEELYRRAEAAHRSTELQQAGTFELAEIVLRWEQGRLGELSGLVPTNPLVSAWTSAVTDAAAGRDGADVALRAEVLRNEPEVWTSHGRFALLAHAVADRGLVDLAQPLLKRMAHLERYLGTLGQIGTVGPMALAMARLADLAGDRESAHRYLATASRVAERSGGAAASLRCRMLAATWSARNGGPPPSCDPEAEFGAIRAEAAQLGLTGLAGQAADLLAPGAHRHR